MAQEIISEKKKNELKTELGGGVYFIATYMILLGLGSFAYLAWATYNAPEIQLALQGQASLPLAFLNSIGIIIPLVVVFLGFSAVQLGLKIANVDLASIRWAQVALLWLFIGSIVVAVVLFFIRSQVVVGSEGSLATEFSAGAGFMATLPAVLLGLVSGAALWWYSQHQEVIYRNETLTGRNLRMGWNFLVPTCVILIVIAARPLETTFITSLTDKRFGGTEAVNFVGLDNYTRLLSMRLDIVGCRRDDDGTCARDADGNVRYELIPRDYLQAGFRHAFEFAYSEQNALVLSGTDSAFLGGVTNTIHFTIVSVTFELFLGLFIAMVVNSKFKGRGLMRAVMLVPWAIPTVISARLWELMLRDNLSGVINQMLVSWGLIDAPLAWLTNNDLQLNALIMVDVWKTAPFMALLLLAGLQVIPDDLYEAAQVDGTNRFQQFIYITLPLLRPTIAVALVFRTLDALRVFDVFQVLLSRQKVSMATYNYEVLIQSQDAGYASAISVIIFILISLFTLAYVRSVKIEAA
jgi:trehalose/maltose transport system permease protein